MNTLKNEIVELNFAEIDQVDGAGPVQDSLESVSATAAGVAAGTSNKKVRAIATAVSLAADAAAGVAEYFGV